MKKLLRLDPKTLVHNPRSTLSSWTRYQPLVEAAMAIHPKPYVYHPTSLSPATVASRIRDAIRGALAFDYPCNVSNAELKRWYDEVVVRFDRESVWIGPLEKAKTEPVGGVEAPTTSNLYSYDTLTFEEVTAFAKLLSNERIRGPVVVRNPPDVTLLEDQNVQVLKKDDGSLVLI